MDKVLIGSVTLRKDTVMYNGSFQYAASFEELLVPEGEYPIYAYKDDLVEQDGHKKLGWRNYIGYEGTVMRGNVGGRPGEHTYYHAMIYDYELARLFYDGHDKHGNEYKLFNNWYMKLRECEYQGERLFTMDVIMKGENK